MQFASGANRVGLGQSPFVSLAVFLLSWRELCTDAGRGSRWKVSQNSGGICCN